MNLSPVPIQKFFDNNGAPLVSGLLFTYVAGTSTKIATYTDSTGGTPNTNPIVLNFRGECALWLDPTLSYKLVIAPSTDTDPPSNAIWTADNVRAGVDYSTLTQQFIGQILYPQTTAEALAVVTPTSYWYQEGDIRRYGATIGSSNNASAINSALLVSANGGSAAFIPPGTWKYTSTLNATVVSSMYGTGENSVLAPQSCDGLTFTNQGTTIGSRFFRDFVITGTTTTTNKGIVALMTQASGGRIEGVLFENISIQNFQYGVYGYGYYRALFTNCYLFNNTNGFWFVEKSIKVLIRDTYVVRSPVATPGDGSIALNCDLLAGVRPEDITADGCFFYGHDIGVSFGNVLYSGINNCDVDQTQTCCVDITTVNGGCRVTHSWLNTARSVSAATFGIRINALGSPNPDEITLLDNFVSCTTANASSVGITVGGNQAGVTVLSNTVGTSAAPFATGLSITGNTCRAKYNTIYASTTAVTVNSSATGVEVGPNTNQNGTPLTFSSLTPPNFSYYANGTFTISLTGTTGPVTGTVSWNATGRMIALTVPNSGIFGSNNSTTTMTGTGLPAALWPNTDQVSITNVIGSGVGSLGYTTFAAATGTITFKKDANGAAFTSDVLGKGLNGGITVYSYG